jgi:hypothetical protein
MLHNLLISVLIPKLDGEFGMRPDSPSRHHLPAEIRMGHLKRKGSPVNTRVDTHFWPVIMPKLEG